ncbi:MAG TPA: family 16 glycoside hydrolase, partial [Planctomycetaceae bacterium]|nr:family 16 glycoside hydrolase [Planctomycetaceae bacterium]
MPGSPVLQRGFLFGLMLGATAWLPGCKGGDAQPMQKPPASAPTPDLGAPEDSSNTMPPVLAPEPVVPTPSEEKTAPAKENEAAAATKWRSLFDGKTLANWKSIEFGGEGEVTVMDGKIVMQRGSDITGIVYTGAPLPKVNYEITFEAQRIDGLDFFSGLVFPYKEDYCSFVVGGWGGGVIGLSSVDGIYANENSTASHEVFKPEQWYRIRLRVGDTFV